MILNMQQDETRKWIACVVVASDGVLSDKFKQMIDAPGWDDKTIDFRITMNGVEFFIALVPTLRDIVESMIRSREYDVRDEYRIKIDNLNHEIKLLQSRTLWDMIKLNFKRKKK